MTVLQVYVDDHCWTCQESHRIIAEIRPLFPDVLIQVLDLGRDPHPDKIFAAPTYVLNGRIIALGNPHPHDLQRLLSSAIIENQPS